MDPDAQIGQVPGSVESIKKAKHESLAGQGAWLGKT